jgi:murein DD-endopeptidase MepM/ murein hydrolase activator NlpD|uniref:murein hydrolase activator EnvC family protein n=1 Tax=Flavobacterium sp. TaxID=239 RepID=UPI00404A0999
MSVQKEKRQLLRKRLYNKRRLVILNEDTFEEIFSLKLNLMNVFVVMTISAILLISITTYIIAFTPLREYIPGYASTFLEKKAIELTEQTALLETELQKNKLYINSIQKVLNGDIEYAKLNKDSILASQMEDISNLNLYPDKADSLLRLQVAQEDKYNLFEKSQPRVNIVLFPPAIGKIIKPFDTKEKHTYIEIALSNNTPIKAIANGTVILADWIPSQGNIVIIRHNDGIISTYKKLASLTKSQGDIVRTSEVVGLAGETLDFELWKDGYPINPTQFIDLD